MSFDDIVGDFTLRASREQFDQIERYVNEEFRSEDAADIKTARVVDLAISVGIAEGKRLEPNGADPYRTGAGSVDQHRVLRTLIEHKHSDKEGEELVEVMREYFEGGVQEVAGEIADKGYFEVEQYLPEEISNGDT